jgi:hypothetical protein
VVRRYRSLSFAAPVILAAGLICASPGVTLADNPPPGQVLSNYESSTGSDIVRDCGFSTPLPADPGDSLWLFCDTAVYGFNTQDQWGLTSFITGSTAAQGPSAPGEVPTDLSEVPAPGNGPATLPNSNAPAHFLPVPSGLITTSGEPCDSADGAYAASWISGAARDPANPSDVLVSFNDYCVMGNLDYLAEGYGLAEYDPATNTLDSEATVFSDTSGSALGSQELLGSPIVSGGYLYLFGSYCSEIYDVTCISNAGDAVYLARVRANPTDWTSPGDYQWYTGGSAWTATAAEAGSLISGATPLAISVSDFSALGHGLVLVEQTNDAGAFTVYQASRPAGTWTETTTGTVPCTIEGDDFCHALVAHPELSTSSDLMISYFNPAAAPYYQPSEPAEGHLMVASFPW